MSTEIIMVLGGIVWLLTEVVKKLSKRYLAAVADGRVIASWVATVILLGASGLGYVTLEKGSLLATVAAVVLASGVDGGLQKKKKGE